MLKKLKEKSYLVVGLFVIGLSLLSFHYAQADTNTNAVSLTIAATFNPASPALGSTTQVTVDAGPLDGNDVQIYICLTACNVIPGFGAPSGMVASQLFRNQTTSAMTLPLLLDSSKFKAGDNTIDIYAEYTTVGNAGTITKYKGNKTYPLSVTAGSTTGPATMALVTGQYQFNDQTNIDFPITINYQKNGGSDVTSYQYNCGISGGQPVTINAPTNNFVCKYPETTVQDYTVSVQAFNGTTQLFPQPLTTKISVTGKESTASSSATIKPGDSGLLNLLASVIGFIIQILTTIIYWLFAYIIAPLIEAVLNIHTYKDIFVQVIYPGWLILRNLSNILFIIILLIIGLATLFQVEKYNYKHLLVQVVIAAVMVNFSLVIGQSILGIADTVQNQFLPDNTSVIRSLGYELMVKPVSMINKPDNTVGGGFANLTTPFFLLALALGAFFAFVAILFFLVIRLVGLWILLMLSPAAYVANILPETQKYFKEWWDKFLAYAFITPIFAFFLNIAALFANSHVFGQGSPVFANTVSGNISDFVYLTAGHLTVLVFLFAGLSVAGSSGVVGAKAMTEFVKKGISKPFTFTGKALADRVNRYKTKKAMELFSPKEGDNFLARTLKKGALMGATPMSSWKGYKAQDEEKKKALHGKSEALAFDAFRRGVGVPGFTIIGGGPASRKAAEFEEHEVQERMKNAADQKNPTEVAKMITEAIRTHDKAGVIAGIRLAWKNDIEADVLAKLKKVQSNQGAYQLLHDPANGLSEHEMRSLAAEMNSSARANGSYIGTNLFDYKTNSWTAATADNFETQQEKAAAKKGSLDIAQNGGASTLVDVDSTREGQPDIQSFNFVGAREFIKAADERGNFTKGILTNKERLNEKVRDALLGALKTPENFDRTVEQVKAYLRTKGIDNADDGRIRTDLRAFEDELKKSSGTTAAVRRYDTNAPRTAPAGTPGAGPILAGGAGAPAAGTAGPTNIRNTQNINQDNRTTVGDVNQNVTQNIRTRDAQTRDFTNQVNQALATAVTAGRGNAVRAFRRAARAIPGSTRLIVEHENDYNQARQQPGFDFNRYSEGRRAHLGSEVQRLQTEAQNRAGGTAQRELDEARRNEAVGNAYLDAHIEDL